MSAGTDAAPEAHTKGSAAAGRFAGMGLLALALAYGYGGATITYAFSSDPLGPRAFPLLLAAVLALLSILFIARPGEGETWPKGRAARDVALMIIATAICVRLMPVLGFPISVGALCVVTARLFGASWPVALIGAVGQGLGWWWLFDALGVALPYLPSAFEAGRLVSHPLGS